jgi:7,8-dihydro-6-hydroxymethylpterin-pyrophosphokinase
MHERAFVLVPLLELEPAPMLPGGRDVTSLGSMGDALGAVRLVAPPIPLPVAPAAGG